jgi:hypothetical protein
MDRRLRVGLFVVSIFALASASLVAAQTVITLPRAVLTVGDLLCADTTSSLARCVTLPTGLASAEKTDGSVFVPAHEACSSDNANLVQVRLAANNWALARTAAGAETYNIICSLDGWLQRTTANKGMKINSLALAYQVTTQPLTSHTWGAVATVTYANNAANVVGADLATAPTLQTAVQANPYLTPVTITTPAYLPAAANTALTVEWQAVMQNAGVYRVYGIQVNFSRRDF